MMKNNKNYTLRITLDERDALEEIAARRQRTLAGLVRQIIKEYLRRDHLGIKTVDAEELKKWICENEY